MRARPTEGARSGGARPSTPRPSEPLHAAPRPARPPGRRARLPVIALVGAEHEENLSLRYLAAAVERVGFRPELISSADDGPDTIAARVLTLCPVGVLSGQELRMTIQDYSLGRWTDVSILDVTGGVARPVTPSEPLVVVIDLADETTTGSFTLSGVLRGDGGGATCRIEWTFTFEIRPGGGVVIARRELPLEERQPARIALVRRDGRDVELEVGSPGPDPGEIRWSVSGGRILSQEGARLIWRLPARAGLYQAELVIDHGQRGLSFDVLALAVG